MRRCNQCNKNLTNKMDSCVKGIMYCQDCFFGLPENLLIEAESEITGADKSYRIVSYWNCRSWREHLNLSGSKSTAETAAIDISKRYPHRDVVLTGTDVEQDIYQNGQLIHSKGGVE